MERDVDQLTIDAALNRHRLDTVAVPRPDR
jgi:hypothetical protein